MDNVTIGQIAGAMGTIVVIVGFVMAIYKWYKSTFSDKFKAIDNEIDEVKQRLDFVEQKKTEYEKELQNSKFERMILLRGELAALKGLAKISNINSATDSINESIEEIEKYMMEKSHDYFYLTKK